MHDSLSPFEERLAHPNLILAGAPRSGSSTLLGHLQAHPEITMIGGGAIERAGMPDQGHPLINPFGITKGPETLAMMRRINSPWDERTPIVGLAMRYALYMPHIAFNVRETVEDPKILFILRDPVARAFSSFTHAAAGTHEESFDAQVEASFAAIEAASAFKERNRFHEVNAADQIANFIDRSCYHPHLIRWFQLFPRESILVLRFEELKQRPADTMVDVARFLGIAEPVPAEEEIHRGKSRNPETIDPGTEARLRELFEPYNRRLFELLDWPADTWTPGSAPT